MATCFAACQTTADYLAAAESINADLTVVGPETPLAAGIVAVHLVLWLTLRFSTVILRVLGRSGVTLVTRIAGLLLSAIAVQLAADGIAKFVAAN